MTQADEATERVKATWSAGDFGVTARRVTTVSEEAVAAAGLTGEESVLDVGCGTGNSAIPAAKTGASVTALDIVDHLLEQGRARAKEAGVEVDWVEGDAADLPFEDASFDVVLSVLGCMFAPDHQAAAGEIARVLKPGGRIAIAAWTPDSTVAASFAEVAEFMPPPPEGFQPPVLWGDPDHVTSLFEGSGLDLSFERSANPFRFDSAEEMMEELTTYFGPMVMLRRALEEAGNWEMARQKLITSAEEDNTSAEGDLRYDSDFLITTGVKAG